MYSNVSKFDNENALMTFSNPSFLERKMHPHLKLESESLKQMQVETWICGHGFLLLPSPPDKSFATTLNIFQNYPLDTETRLKFIFSLIPNPLRNWNQKGRNESTGQESF